MTTFNGGGTFLVNEFKEGGTLSFQMINVGDAPLYFDTLKNTTFNNCYLTPNSVRLVNAQLEHLNVQEGNGLTGFAFDNCHWPKHRLKCFPWATFSALPTAMHTLLEQDLKAGKGVYARLKEQAKEAGQAQLASDFYFWQMWFNLQTLSGRKRPFHLGQYYYCASHFGLSVVLPVFWLLLSSWLFTQGFH
jgi:hypothetical protein